MILLFISLFAMTVRAGDINSSLPVNTTQFGGNNVVTGTGSSGAGIPRVTVSSDSNVLATQSGPWTVLQGTTGITNSSGWFVRPTDGTNTITVKAASTAPLATDTALVVVESPNGNQATAANQGTQITQLSSIFAAQSNATQKSQAIDASGNVVTIKASSTHPALTDTAIVTSERPDNLGTVTSGSVSCALTSTTLLAAGTAIMFLSIRNPTTSTATVWIRFDGSAASASAPSIDLPPGAEATFFAYGTSFLPGSQFNCISGGAAASTLGYFYK